MNRRDFVIALFTFCCAGAAAPGQELKPIVLPKPDTEGGAPLMRALAERKTTRVFSDQPLSAQMLSNLLWAAFGQNRPKADRPGIGRTAPSAMNRQEVDLYVALPDGVYVYEAEPHRLRPALPGDQRARLGPEAAARAAVTIVYVADAQAAWAQVDTGFIGQNVYLFAAANGLNAWFRSLNADAVAAALKLEAPKRPLYAQTVGYPPK